MIPFNKLYEYENLERVTLDSGDRYYVDPTGQQLSSVTTILSATSYKPELEAWKDFVGEKKAKQVVEEATALGSLMHTHLENHIQGIDRPGGTNLIRVMATQMSDEIINKGLSKVNEVWGMEEILYVPGLYAGTADLIGVYENEPAIMDYKSAKKIRTEKQIEDYFCQGAAYAIAHNDLYGTDIQKIVIFMVSRDLKFKEFIINRDEFSTWRDKWLNRMEKFLEIDSLKKSIRSGE